MPFINPIQYWNIILILVLIQLGIMLFWGWNLKRRIKNKYCISGSSYKIFHSDNYSPVSPYNIPEYPQYDIVVVKFDTNGKIKNETFYTKLGDWVYFEYQNGQKVQTNISLRSSWLLIICACCGVFIGIAFSLINFTNIFIGIDNFFLETVRNITKTFFSLLIYSTAITLYLKPFFEK